MSTAGAEGRKPSTTEPDPLSHPHLLFVTATRIGDAVLSTGLLDHLLSRLPQVRATVACGPAPAPLFAAVPGVERVVPLIKGPLARHWIGLWGACLFRRWDRVVDLRRSALGLLLPGAWGRMPLRPSPRAAREHRVVELGRLVGRETAPPPPRLWWDDGHGAEAARLVPDDAPVLALGPTANWRGKEWPARRFAALATALTAADGPLPGGRIAVFGAAAERAAATATLERLPAGRTIDLVGRLDLVTVAACLARASLFVGNDSGLMHIAAATGTPTLGLFGPSPAWRYAPWGEHAAVAQTAIPYETLVGAPDFDHRATDSLMGSLSVETVVDAAQALLRSPAAVVP